VERRGECIVYNSPIVTHSIFQDYVEAGTGTENEALGRDSKDEERDSDQYLESDDSTLRKNGGRDSDDGFTRSCLLF
jgi:hypothetical protein